MLDRNFYRKGPNHQKAFGVNTPVTFLDIRKRFNFRSIQIGKWVTKAEQQFAAPLFYDALCDLMTILGVDENVISLRGSLALQYGCGGQRGVSAHYDSLTRSFALAKNAGPGSIAHEWFHAFDHYISERSFKDVGRGEFASKAWLDNVDEIEHPLNELLMQCYQTIILNEEADEPNEYFNTAVVVDTSLDSDYYSRPEELCARAFEAYVQDAAVKNNFLVKGTQKSHEAKLGLYPQAGHRLRINATFKQYFYQLGRALERQQKKGLK